VLLLLAPHEAHVAEARLPLLPRPLLPPPAARAASKHAPRATAGRVAKTATAKALRRKLPPTTAAAECHVTADTSSDECRRSAARMPKLLRPHVPKAPRAPRATAPLQPRRGRGVNADACAPAAQQPRGQENAAPTASAAAQPVVAHHFADDADEDDEDTDAAAAVRWLFAAPPSPLPARAATVTSSVGGFEALFAEDGAAAVAARARAMLAREGVAPRAASPRRTRAARAAAAPDAPTTHALLHAPPTAAAAERGTPAADADADNVDDDAAALLLPHDAALLFCDDDDDAMRCAPLLLLPADMRLGFAHAAASHAETGDAVHDGVLDAAALPLLPPSPLLLPRAHGVLCVQASAPLAGALLSGGGWCDARRRGGARGGARRGARGCCVACGLLPRRRRR
jgi:hypothetical protein